MGSLNRHAFARYPGLAWHGLLVIYTARSSCIEMQIAVATSRRCTQPPPRLLQLSVIMPRKLMVHA